MTTAAAHTTNGILDDPPLERVRFYVRNFAILFYEFFDGPISRWVARAKHAKACAWIRAAEASVRSAMLAQAAVLAPQLPPLAATRTAAAPRARPARKPAAPPAEGEARPPVFRAWKRSDFTLPVARPVAGASPGPRAPTSPVVNIRPLARRYEALWHAVETPDIHIRRLARRLCAVKARSNECIQICRSPRLHPEHTRYIETDLRILREDANAALRGLFCNSS